MDDEQDDLPPQSKEDMKGLKVKRSKLKAAVTTSATRLQTGINRKLAEKVIDSYDLELETAFLDFVTVDSKYSQAVGEHDEWKEEFDVINQLDCTAYTKAVDQLYGEARECYDLHILNKTKATFEELYESLAKLWGKIDKESDCNQIRKDLKRVERISAQVSSLKEMKSDHQSVDWSGLSTRIEETLTNIEESEDLADQRMKALSMKEVPITPASTISATEPTNSNTQVPPLSTASNIMSTGFPHLPMSSMNPLHHLLPTSSYPSPMSFQNPMSTYQSYPYTMSMYQSPQTPMSLHQPPQSPMSMYQSIPNPLSTYPSFSHPASLPPASTTMSPSSHIPPQLPTFPVGTGHSQIRVKKAEIPSFSGERKDWAEFQCLWLKLAVPAYPCKETLASQLRILVKGGKAESLLANISITGPEAVDLMWGRLREYYEDTATSVDEILRKLNNLKPVKPEDYKALVEFADKIEGCYTQLSTLHQLESISMREVDQLSTLLPPSVRESWHEIYQRLPTYDKLHPYGGFASFMVVKRRDVSRLIGVSETTKKKVYTHSTEVNPERKEIQSKISRPRCAVHKGGGAGNHTTEKCFTFSKMSGDEKINVLKEVNACFRCFLYHPRGRCRYREPCGVCRKQGHHTLLCMTNKNGEKSITSPQVNIPVPVTSSCTYRKSTGLYAIFTVQVVGNKRRSTIFTDDGSDSSYITNTAARRLGAKEKGKYILNLTTTGGQEKQIQSTLYELAIVTNSGKIATIQMFGIDQITGKLARLNLPVLSKLFPDFDTSSLQRCSSEVDVLLGTDYFGLHPKEEIDSAGPNLSLMQGALGICIQGSHPLLQLENYGDSNSTLMDTLKNAGIISHEAHHVQSRHSVDINQYILGEELATIVSPKCGSCRCGKCPMPGHTYSFQEEVELKIIQKGLKYDDKNQCWSTTYPWKFNPSTLPDNYSPTLSTLRSLERRLQKDEEKAQVYQTQMVDMLERKVARKVFDQELSDYRGPVFYISHLGVPNPKSMSTPYRIVFNSSQVYKGVSLNNFLYKGPDCYMNNQLGILLRWREDHVAVVGDICKMYNSVYLETMEQHCHRFLWTNLKFGSEPEIYVMTRVNMGDRPAGSISTEALYKTADMFQHDNPSAAELLKHGSYIDDLLGSAASREEAEELTGGAENMLLKGGFQIKFWYISGDQLEGDAKLTEVLGVCWIPESDRLTFNTSLNFSPKKHGVHILPDLEPSEIPESIPEVLTKRMVLSQMMRVYDPLGLICAFTLQGKILLRQTWEKEIGWDEQLPPELKEKWMKFLCSIYEVRKLQYPRSTKPKDALGVPSLILLSDASEKAYGVVAYARWECRDGSYKCRFILAKNKIAPLTKRTTPQLELNGAVLSKRARVVIEKEMRQEFRSVIHLTDSETVLAMLHKTSTRFKLYEGIRVGEIQSATEGDVSCWAWVAGVSNTSDWLTRGKDPGEISEDSEWFSGPAFLRLPEEEWGLKFNPITEDPLPGEKNIVTTNASVCEPPIVDYLKFNSYRKLENTLARILNMASQARLKAVKDQLTTTLLEKAEKIILKDVQTSIQEECKKVKDGKVGGEFHSLCPVAIDGYWRVGTRLTYNPMVPDNEPQYLLPTKHRVTKLLMIRAHEDADHKSRDSTVARFRQKYWTPRAAKLASNVVNRCLPCRLKKRKLVKQKMGLLPEVRSKPAAPFTYTMVDYFGHFYVRGDVQKRVTGKAWGVIFTDLVSRAVHLEAVYSYGTDAFMIALSKFASIRGYPRKMFSDPGSNLTSASKELSDAWETMWKEDDKIVTKSAENGMDWIFSAADAPWQNGAVESLVKTVKKSILFAMKDQRLSPSEFSGLLYEVLNIVNERPIGISPPSDAELSVLTPNSLLLGRSVAKNPGGWHPTTSTLQRFHLIQQIAASFWSQWMKTAAPGLILDDKWQTRGRNLQPGDIVLIMEDSAIKAEYRLAMVDEVFTGVDGLVRKVKVSYRRYKVGEVGVKYTGSTCQSVIRPVQRLVLILPVDYDHTID